MRDDDDIWLDSLAGNDDPEPQKAAAAGRAIRTALLARQAAQQLRLAGPDAQREDALIARARAEGLLPPTVAVRPRRWPALLAAAAIAGLAVGLSLQMRSKPAPPATRGAPGEIARIKVADPSRLKLELIRELRAAGIEAHGYQSLGREGIDADLPAPLSPAALEVLTRHGIALPAGSVLQVEIEPATP